MDWCFVLFNDIEAYNIEMIVFVDVVFMKKIHDLKKVCSLYRYLWTTDDCRHTTGHLLCATEDFRTYDRPFDIYNGGVSYIRQTVPYLQQRTL